MSLLHQSVPGPRRAHPGFFTDEQVEADPEPGHQGLVALYVALKSKPMAILYGPPDSGKLAAARALGANLANGGTMCLQEMVGHAWWASGLESVAVFTAAQDRFNRDKIQAMFEESARCQGAGHLHVALLSRISPAEWGYLAELAAQLRHGQVLEGPVSRRRRSLPDARNILVIGTADSVAPRPWDPDLLRDASILPWPSPQGEGIPSAPALRRFLEEGRPFDQARQREPRAALRRLRGLGGWRDERLRPLLAIANSMCIDHVPGANRAASEALVYIANSWTWDGKGLFAPAFEENFRMAVQLAVVLAMVPRLQGHPGACREFRGKIASIAGEWWVPIKLFMV